MESRFTDNADSMIPALKIQQAGLIFNEVSGYSSLRINRERERESPASIPAVVST